MKARAGRLGAGVCMNEGCVEMRQQKREESAFRARLPVVVQERRVGDGSSLGLVGNRKKAYKR